MKSLSIWEPWASLIAAGLKRFEMRSWQTKYRGPLLICAGKIVKRLKLDVSGDLKTMNAIIKNNIAFHPGHALCVVDLTDSKKTVLSEWVQQVKLIGGPWEKKSWELANVRRFKEPWPVRGKQGLFDVPDEEIARHELMELTP